MSSQTDIVFVTGASRSGTTMLSRVLGNHSRILGLNELHYFGDLWDPAGGFGRIEKSRLESLAAALFARQAQGVWGQGPTESDFQRAEKLVEQLQPEQCTAAGVFAEALGQLSTEAGKEMTCEQTPRNIFYAQRILDAFPNARVIHMIRDPRAVLASQKNRWRLRRLGGKHIPLSEAIRTWFNYHPVTMCRLWVNASEAALRLLEHPRFMILRFEDLVEDPERYVRKLCDFVGVKFEPDMLVVPQWGSSNVPRRLEKQGISTEMLHQWEEVLTDGEVLVTEIMTRPLMGRFSYKPNSTSERRFMTLFSYMLRYPVHLAGVVLTNPRRAWIQLKAMLQSNSKD